MTAKIETLYTADEGTMWVVLDHMQVTKCATRFEVLAYADSCASFTDSDDITHLWKQLEALETEGPCIAAVSVPRLGATPYSFHVVWVAQ